jgi:hypothetical protein
MQGSSLDEAGKVQFLHVFRGLHQSLPALACKLVRHLDLPAVARSFSGPASSTLSHKARQRQIEIKGDT